MTRVSFSGIGAGDIEEDAPRAASVSAKSPTARSCHELHRGPEKTNPEAGTLHHAVAMTGRWKLSSREMLFIFAFWTFLATLSAVNRVLDPRGFGFRMASPAGPIALEYIASWLWALATPLGFWFAS